MYSYIFEHCGVLDLLSRSLYTVIFQEDSLPLGQSGNEHLVNVLWRHLRLWLWLTNFLFNFQDLTLSHYWILVKLWF